METVVERPAALDVHKEQLTACVRVPVARGRRVQYVAEFKTTVQGLLALRDWLKAHGATQVAMEASGVYWKPPWAILEDELECLPSTSAMSSRCPVARPTSPMRPGCANCWRPGY
jgi:transposase